MNSQVVSNYNYHRIKWQLTLVPFQAQVIQNQYQQRLLMQQKEAAMINQQRLELERARIQTSLANAASVSEVIELD